MNLVKEKNLSEVSNNETIDDKLKKQFLEYYNDRLNEVSRKIKKYNKIKSKIESQLIEINNNKITKECKAIKNYALFNKMNIRKVNIVKMYRSSAGINGWANYKHDLRNNIEELKDYKHKYNHVQLKDMEKLRI